MNGIPASLARVDLRRALPVAIAAAVFAYAASHRIVDDDEGYYALAGRAMLAGQAPYREFFLPQMPLGPFAYGVVSAVFGPGLVALRWFAAACALGTTLIAERVARRAGGAAAGSVAVALIVAHTLFWEWAPTVKTFPLALLFGTASLALCARADATARVLFVSGLCAGLAVAARALSLPVLITVLASPWFTISDPTRRVRLALWAAAGAGLALAPVVAVAALDPAAFFFDNVGYHAIRSPGLGLVKDLPQKLDVARAVFLTPLGARRPDATGIQSTALCVAAFLSLRALRRRGDAEALAAVAPFAVAAVLLALLGFLPSPSWSQYFAACIPPASVVVAAGWPSDPRRLRVPALLLSAYVVVAAPAFVSRVVRQPAFLRPATFDAVARGLDAVTPPGTPVAAHDPAFLVASRRAPVPAAINPFAREHASRLTEDQRRRYHVSTEREFCDAMLTSRASFVAGRGLVIEAAAPLKEAGWSKAAAFPGATIWVAPEAVGP